ncbi:MAG TPA: galactosyltransferase-related protein [Candidatus Competibacter sp.]|nr:hypothetical protein [Candidatus Competibacteraceae bacterium]HRW64689.1 galactosyltransferase-related protein [Candidatus Competibacter sp.]
MNVFYTGKALLGVLLKDWRYYRRALNAQGRAYLTLCNRTERLETAPDGNGYRCDWRYTSDLHAPKHLPSLGLKLLCRALADHPIQRLPEPRATSASPDISFIIGHRGGERLPHLLTTLESIAGQEGASVECLVVEQDQQAHLFGYLPAWVRYLYTPPPTPDLPYCRAWAFNIGVRHARGSVLVLHDNDMLVPTDYAARILQHIRQGYEALNLKRFVFYLSEAHSRGVFAGTAELMKRVPETIVQNLEAGGSIAITREGYERIGGFDEAFVGWGGEDNEFWERAHTLKVWPYGYLSLVHLWHPSQPGKYQPDNPTLRRHRELSEIPANERIARLRTLVQGEMAGPQGWTGKGPAR